MKAGLTVKKVHKETGVARSTLYEILKKHELTGGSMATRKNKLFFNVAF